MKLDAKTINSLTLPKGKSDVIHFDASVSGFGYRLRRSGDEVRKSWIAQYRRLGATRRVLLGSAEILTAEQARTAAKKILGAVALGQDPQAEKAARRAQEKFTLASVADEYIKAKESAVRASTLIETRRYLTGSYFKPLHNVPLDAIGRRDVAARLLVITRENGNVTAARARSALSAAYSWAVGQGLCEANPVAGTNKPNDSQPRERVLSDLELAAIWNACQDDDFGRIVKLLMLLGARRSEVGGMRESELNRECGTWTIPAARVKNGRQHVLPLAGLALHIVESVPQRVGRDQLFGDRAPAGYTTWAIGKAQLDARLGNRVAPWTLHDLRRSLCTRMGDLGVLPHITEQILNHQSGHRAGPAGVYNRSPYEQEVRAAMALWSDHIRTLVEGGERKIVPMQRQAS
jgi:integrase